MKRQRTKFLDDSCLYKQLRPIGLQFIHKEFIHATAVMAAVPSKYNDIKQTSANIRLAQLAYRTVDNNAGIWVSQRAAFIQSTSLVYVPQSMRLNQNQQNNRSLSDRIRKTLFGNEMLQHSAENKKGRLVPNELAEVT